MFLQLFEVFEFIDQPFDFMRKCLVELFKVVLRFPPPAHEKSCRIMRKSLGNHTNKLFLEPKYAKIGKFGGVQTSQGRQVLACGLAHHFFP